jgi:DNA topoisomerase-1
MQVTARDARGRKQYRYHPEYRAARERSKFRRILEFSDLLPRIRAQVERDLGAPSLSRTQLLATLVRLLDLTFIRIGNEEYARTNGSFGLTTLRDHHVQVRAGTLRFAFRGKSGVRRMVTLTDRRLARIIKRLQDLPGQELFQYLDEEGKPRSIGSDDVNAYLRKISGRRITAKDFRTWAGTVLAARALAEAGAASSVTEAKARVIVAIDHVARRLGNTRAVCRQFYIHPTIIESYHAGALVPLDTEGSADESGTLRADEVRVLQFLKSRGGTTGRSTTLGRERLRAS